MRGTQPNPQRQYATAADYWSDIDRFSIARDDSAVVIDGLCSPLRGRACCLHEEADLSELVGAHGLGDCDGPTLYSSPATYDRGERERYRRYAELKPLESKPYKRQVRYEVQPPPHRPKPVKVKPPPKRGELPDGERLMRILAPWIDAFAVFRDGVCVRSQRPALWMIGKLFGECAKVLEDDCPNVRWTWADPADFAASRIP